MRRLSIALPIALPLVLVSTLVLQGCDWGIRGDTTGYLIQAELKGGEECYMVLNKRKIIAKTKAGGVVVSPDQPITEVDIPPDTIVVDDTEVTRPFSPANRATHMNSNQ